MILPKIYQCHFVYSPRGSKPKGWRFYCRKTTYYNRSIRRNTEGVSKLVKGNEDKPQPTTTKFLNWNRYSTSKLRLDY